MRGGGGHVKFRKGVFFSHVEGGGHKQFWGSLYVVA